MVLQGEIRLPPAQVDFEHGLAQAHGVAEAHVVDPALHTGGELRQGDGAGAVGRGQAAQAAAEIETLAV